MFSFPHVTMESCTVCDALVSRQGGAIGIVIDWTCNLDKDVKHCRPKYNFHGLYGNPAETDKARASVGYNFRCADVLPWTEMDSAEILLMRYEYCEKYTCFFYC